MLAYCKNGVVIATHEESQDVPASAYGSGVIIVPLATPILAGSALPSNLSADTLRGCARMKRNSVINAGCVVVLSPSKSIPTWADDGTVASLTGLVVAAGLNSSFSTTWKGRDGNFYPLTTSEISSFGFGLLTWKASVFSAEQAVCAKIANGQISSITEIDAAAWPSNGG